jgi:hypothetical protein
MGLLPLTETERQYLKQLIRETFYEIEDERKVKPQVTLEMTEFVNLYFSPTFDSEIMGYELPYDLYLSVTKDEKYSKLEFVHRFRKACMAAKHLGVVEPARVSTMKGLRWVRFATDAEIRERRAAKD